MKKHSWLSIIFLFLIAAPVYAQESEVNAGTWVLGMGVLVVLLLLGLMWRVLKMKPKAIPETSAPPRQAPQRQEQTRVYGELLVLEGIENKDRIPVTKQEFTLGRGAEFNDYELNLQGVSRKHLKLVLDGTDNRMYVADLDSVNGTMLNGKPLAPNKFHPLYAGDEISISTLVLRWNPLRGVEGGKRPQTEQSSPTAKITPEEQW